MTAQTRIVVIGAGQAGLSLCMQLRAGGHDGPLTLVGSEPLAPYQRPPLSKAYPAGDFAQSRLFLKPDAFYAKAGIDLRLGTPATAIDRNTRRVRLASGEELDYDLLALTTGARARPLPDTLLLRTLADADRIAERLATSSRLLVVGGGYLGLEIAATARKLGLEVTVAEAAPRLLARVTNEETARRIAALHLEHGVCFRMSAALEAITPAGPGITARFADGTTLEADVAIAGIGSIPETALAEAAGLAIENGIRVGSDCRTSDPAIFAAGDCTSFPYQGRRVRLESVQNAIDQADAAAQNMLGNNTPYESVPWFWSNQYDARLQIAGLLQDADQTILRTASDIRPASIWHFRDGALIAVDAIDDPRAFMVGKHLLAEDGTIDPAVIPDMSVDLKSLLPAKPGPGAGAAGQDGSGAD